MSRIDGRENNKLRKIKVTKNYIVHPEGSCLIEFGKTKVICNATLENDVPPFLKGKQQGWVTAEYGMLPRSTNTRMRRDKTASGGRTMEIQRLIGRSLRGVVDMQKLGERTIKIDCDVIQADGGTRTAAITGGYIALALAIKKGLKSGLLETNPLLHAVAAVSVGIFEGQLICDLNYHEDSKAEMDMNVVMLDNQKFMEVQGTAEGAPYSRKQLDDLLKIANKAIQELIVIQQKTVGPIG